MRKLYEMPNTVVNLRTEEEYNEYMDMCADVGWVWNSGKSPNSINKRFAYYEEEYCIRIEDNFGYARKEFYLSEGYQIITFQELKRRLQMFKEGDIIVNKNGERKILGICGEVLFTSVTDHFKDAGDAYTQHELDDFGYKLKSDTVDITVEGKTKTISRESAKALNLI